MSTQTDCDDKKLIFVEALIAILLGSVLVNLWIRVINNFAYHTLKLNPDSTSWALLVALIATVILVVYVIFILDSDTSLQVRKTLTGIVVSSTASGANSSSISASTDLMDINYVDNVDTTPDTVDTSADVPV